MSIESSRWRRIGFAGHKPRRSMIRVAIPPIVGRDDVQQHRVPIGRLDQSQRPRERYAQRRKHSPRKSKPEEKNERQNKTFMDAGNVVRR